ncbi:MAG: 16S rRNA (guanine(527)-N(7))-methyltransferase RsmG [Acidobacteria bacterium]|nr:16S rRNA (guanine(527)-N(7))-methyltransferase RsmG [Acidobacteriota bacterium]
MSGTHPEITKLLRAAASELKLSLTQRQLEQLATHFALLLRWNPKINLTSLRRPEEIATRHFEESLFLLKVIPCTPGLLVDVGSGAGFPGLPLKIACPSLSTVLLESNHKKAAFLKEVVRSCKLEGVEVRTERLEDAVGAALSLPPEESGSGSALSEGLHGDLTARASLVTLRAVKTSRELLSNLAKLLAPHGQLALFLGTNDATSIAATPGFQWSAPSPIPHSDRRVILLGRHAA